MEEKLKSLPSSDSEFWDGNKQTIKVEKRSCKHEFIRRTGLEVECKVCGIGFVLSPNSSLKDGHIYIENQLVI